MIIIRTPYRVSLFGGGTDHPSWYVDNGGAVLSFTIDKYSYINVRELPPFFEHTHRISYSKVETVTSISDIKHPAVRAGFNKFANEMNLELHHHGDLPARSGVGSSSAFAVGLIHALHAIKGKNVTGLKLAELAIELEQKDLAENVGSQDQIACALGGVNFIEFGKGPTWSAKPISLSENYRNEIEQRMVLLYSGIDRLSSDISRTLIENLESKFAYMRRTHELADECLNILKSEGDLTQVGEMLNESWDLKRRMNPAAVTPALEDFFVKAKSAGAEGGKILGAGGGGFCLFWVKPETRDSFIKKMSPSVYVPARIGLEGSTRII
jgi:D-glycero-alpha-D-manno-heptose-7-phosphate kinase